MSNINRTLITEIILLGFSSDLKINIMLFIIFFAIFLMTILGNSLIIVMIIISPSLRTPMYFFLCILSFLDVCNSTFVVPRLLFDLLSSKKSISVGACAIQYYTIMLVEGAECLLLAIMAYDRYLAICWPLHYPVLMRWSICYQLTAFMWIISFLIFVFPSLASPMALCNPNQVNHYTCELLAITKLTCDHVYSSDITILIICFSSILLPFVFIIGTYTCIMSSVLRMKSAEKSKAFSTCTSHITVVAFYFGAAMIMYFGPTSDYTTSHGKYISVFYNILCPMLNPIIYSLNNKEVKESMRKLYISTLNT